MKAKNLLKKAFLLLALVGGTSSAWASSVSDLATISADHSVAFADIMNATALSKGTLYDSNYLLSVDGNNYSNNKGTNSTISKLNCCRVKSNSQDRLAFKVSGACTLTIYAETRTDRKPFLNTDGSTTQSITGTFDGNGKATYTIPAADTYYIVGSGDFFLAGLEFTFPSADAPTITKQPVSATYEKDDPATALSVTASASAGTLQYEWYGNTTESTEGASIVQAKSTTVTYTPSTSSVGTTYYYCKVYDNNGNTDSEFATVNVVNAIAPEISYSTPAVTINCSGSGTIYYTTDGSVPSSSNGTEYSAPFNLTGSCSVRAVAKVGENYSDLVKYDCYVDQSSAEGFLISTGYQSGTNSGSVWTSNDGNFTLSKPEGDFNWSNHLFPGMHGHKMDNGIVYTLQPNEDIKITSIKIVGRTWLNGTAATVAVSGGTPASDTWLAGETGNVSYILTKEFAVDANYGEAVTISPTGNQFGCFLEIYGVKRSVPADPEAVAGTTVTWDFTSSSVGTVTASTSNTLSSTSGTSMNITYIAGSSCSRDNTDGLKAGGKTSVSSSNWTDRYFVLQIAKSGTLSITSGSNYGEYKIYKGASSTFSSATSVTTITTTSGGTASANISYDSSNPYIFIGFTDAKKYTKNISWTPVTDDITLTTSANMAGWRAFYDASNGYTLDAYTTAYVATAKNGSTVTMTPLVGGVPSGTPVILKTTSSADSYKMTLTKASVSAYGGTNLLSWTTSAVDSKYRLGYGDEGVGFYPYSGTPSSGAVILDISSSSSRALRLSFGGITGIDQVENGNIESSLPVKRIVNGKLVIEKKGHMFNAAGGILK